MPVNTVNAHVNTQQTDDLRKMMDDQRSKGQPANTANAQAQNQNTILTPQAIGPAVRVDISSQAKQAAGAEKPNDAKKANASGSAKTSADKTDRARVSIVA